VDPAQANTSDAAVDICLLYIIYFIAPHWRRTLQFVYCIHPHRKPDISRRADWHAIYYSARHPAGPAVSWLAVNHVLSQRGLIHIGACTRQT